MHASSKTPDTTVICLMGPTASGKTALAVDLVKRFPFEIISVDSAMVYRGMNIGTAKPSKDILQMAPHRLIDIKDPKTPYSAGQFRRDALREMKDIIQRGNIPLLVGGSMLYFRVLQQGLAQLPLANLSIREELQRRAEDTGWPSLHTELASIDPTAAARIHPRDSQRIQRALEIYLLTGKPLSLLHAEEEGRSHYQFYNFALMPSSREHLYQLITQRFYRMLEGGLVDEVTMLFERGDLSLDLPAIRSVGYYQIWQYLLGQLNYQKMQEAAVTASRQLAKRQMTWLRTWPHLTHLDSAAVDSASTARNIEHIEYILAQGK